MARASKKKPKKSTFERVINTDPFPEPCTGCGLCCYRIVNGVPSNTLCEYGDWKDGKIVCTVPEELRPSVGLSHGNYCAEDNDGGEYDFEGCPFNTGKLLLVTKKHKLVRRKPIKHVPRKAGTKKTNVSGEK